MQEESKLCRGCGETKNFENFSRNRQSRDGRVTRCKKCVSLAAKKFREDFPERVNRRERAAYARKIEKEPGLASRLSRERRLKDPEAYRAERRLLYAKDPSKRNAYRTKSYQKNKEKELFKNREWALANPAKKTRYASIRRAKLAMRTPAWLTAADLACMDLIYECAKVWSAETGVAYEVDHVYPLQGKYVSGLHVPDNLQILTASENRSKNNRWKPQ